MSNDRAVELLVKALEVIADQQNWFYEYEEIGGRSTWRGVGEPDEIAREALKGARAVLVADKVFYERGGEDGVTVG